jgi:Transcriptional regulatory protein, C terminal
MALIDARGAVVSKDALMARVWPGRVVEENNLQTQIAALRATFGAERELIRTVSGRGYLFTGEIRILSANQDEHAVAATTGPGAMLPPTNLPEQVSELIGRDDELHEIVTLTAMHRLHNRPGRVDAPRSATRSGRAGGARRAVRITLNATLIAARRSVPSCHRHSGGADCAHSLAAGPTDGNAVQPPQPDQDPTCHVNRDEAHSPRCGGEAPVSGQHKLGNGTVPRGKLPTPVLALTDALGGSPAVHNGRDPVWSASVNRDQQRVAASFNRPPPRRRHDASHEVR